MNDDNKIDLFEALKKTLVAVSEQPEADEEEAAAPAPIDYTSDMEADAKAIAQRIQEMLGPDVKVAAFVPAQEPESSPLPTLESIQRCIRAHQEACVRSDESMRKVREEFRASSVPAVCLRMLDTGDMAEIRREMGQEGQLGPLTAELSDAEICDWVRFKTDGNSATAVAFGLYAGALLARIGRTMQEVIALGSDPIFSARVANMEVTRDTVGKLALESLASEARAAAQKPAGN